MAKNEDDLNSYLINGFEGAITELCQLIFIHEQEICSLQAEKLQSKQAIIDLCNDQEKLKQEIARLKKNLVKKS